MATWRGKMLVELSLSKQQKENVVDARKRYAACAGSPVTEKRRKNRTVLKALPPQEQYSRTAWIYEWLNLRQSAEPDNPDTDKDLDQPVEPAPIAAVDVDLPQPVADEPVSIDEAPIAIALDLELPQPDKPVSIDEAPIAIALDLDLPQPDEPVSIDEAPIAIALDLELPQPDEPVSIDDPPIAIALELELPQPDEPVSIDEAPIAIALDLELPQPDEPVSIDEAPIAIALDLELPQPDEPVSIDEAPIAIALDLELPQPDEPVSIDEAPIAIALDLELPQPDEPVSIDEAPIAIALNLELPQPDEPVSIDEAPIAIALDLDLPQPDEPVSIDEGHVERSTSIPKKRRRTPSSKMEYNLLTRKLFPRCPITCRKSAVCHSAFSDKQREEILSHFWSMDFAQRSLFLDGHILVQSPKTGKGVKQRTLTYFLPCENGSKKIVCKMMFKGTLGLPCDSMINAFLRRKCGSSEMTDLIKDRRGNKRPTNKLDHQIIIDHINSFKPSTSHYRLEHAPHRRYLDCYLTIRDMYKDFKNKGGNGSYATYRNVFEKQKISFGYPPQDECETCLIFKSHDVEDKDHVASVCVVCNKKINFDDHNRRAAEAREEYRKSHSSLANDDVDVFTADMQKIILLPKLMTKEHFFVSRLSVYNETFARVTDGPDIVVLWHEAIAGRSAAEVASSYVKVLKLSDKRHVVFWADNCSAQNKNWTLYSALATCVNEEWGPASVTVKYLEKGHTFMKADSVHGCIGKKMKKAHEILSFQDFIALCNDSLQSISVVEMNSNDFFLFQGLQRAKSSNTVKMPKLRDLVQAKFIKGSKSLHYKESSFSAVEQEVDFIKPSSVQQLSMPERSVKDRGLDDKKKNDILSLMRAASSKGKLEFWEKINNNV